MTYYLNILFLNHVIFLLVLIITALTLITFCVLLIILFLDSLYRPNITQYPFSVFFDRVIPMCSILFPFFMIIFFKPLDTWFACLLLLICFNIFILVPLLHYWSELRQWDKSSSTVSFDSWKHPRLYKNIAIAMIYPLLWGLYFSMSRFLRLGKSYNVVNYLSESNPDLIVLFLFSLPYLICGIIIILFYLAKIRNYFWSRVSILLYSLHIYLLQFYIYFRMMELLYKSAFLMECLLTINISNKIYKSRWRRVINYLYYNPKVFTVILLSSLLVEILYTKNLYYGIYILFVYPLVYSILSCYFSYLSTNFIFDSCLSDYCSTRYNFLNPRYPLIFWTYFRDAEYYFGFQYEFTYQQTLLIADSMKKKEAQWVLRKKISYDIHQDLLNKRILGRTTSTFCMRLAANYLHINRVRWLHGERLLNVGYKYHSCTALFAKTTYQQIVLLNNSWSHLKHIQAAKHPIESIPSDMYKPSKKIFPLLRKDFMGHQEINTPDNFIPLMEKGVKVEPYNSNNIEHKPVYFSQANPDIIYVFKDSQFIEKRSHAFDQKTNNPGLGNNKVFSEITTQRYNSTIDRFEKHLRSIQPITEQVLQTLTDLKKTSEDPQQHQIIWAKNIHLFPDNFVPPMRIPQNFSYNQFTEEALKKIKAAEIQLKKVSDYLYTKKIPQVNNGIFSKEALDLFEDSFMQTILNQDISTDLPLL